MLATNPETEKLLRGNPGFYFQYPQTFEIQPIQKSLQRHNWEKESSCWCSRRDSFKVRMALTMLADG